MIAVFFGLQCRYTLGAEYSCTVVFLRLHFVGTGRSRNATMYHGTSWYMYSARNIEDF